jgi:hypothetical protein
VLADAKFAEALDFNQRRDNYTVLTVALAAVLFFAAISGRIQSRRSQWFLLGLGLLLFLSLLSHCGLPPARLKLRASTANPLVYAPPAPTRIHRCHPVGWMRRSGASGTLAPCRIP